MRVRPVFWVLLACSCIGVLLLALLRPSYAPAMLRVYVDLQRPLTVGVASLDLHLSDTEGLPIEQAQVHSDAWMPNMLMEPPAKAIRALGHGNYRLQVQFSMAGPWAIKIEAHAPGFTSVQQTLHLQVDGSQSALRASSAPPAVAGGPQPSSPGLAAS